MLALKAQRLFARYSSPDSGIDKDSLIEELFALFEGSIAIQVFSAK